MAVARLVSGACGQVRSALPQNARDAVVAEPEFSWLGRSLQFGKTVAVTGIAGRKQMQFLLENWLYMLLLAVFVAMHRFGFGCGHAHGHGDHRRSQRAGADGTGDVDGNRRAQ